jgi:citrate synthase
VEDKTWNTAITRVKPNSLLLRGYPINELIGRVSFAQAIFLVIMGELPGTNEARMLDAIFVSSIDHGVTPPSSLAARTIASTGASMGAALAGGILSISKHHGGAIEDSMKLFGEAVEKRSGMNKTPKEAAEIIIHEYREQGRRLPGYGHRFHTEDPRSLRLFAIAQDLKIAGEYVEMATAIEKGIATIMGKRLPLNVDGAIAALLCDMSIPPSLANAFFVMARVPGLVAHIHEEQTAMKPMRHINSRDHVYSGPPERGLDGRESLPARGVEK